MYEEVRVLTHSSIRIEAGGEVMYFDPFNIKDAAHDADIIFITHEHYDHFSPEDIAKISNSFTLLVCPESMKERLKETDIDEEFTELVAPGDELEVNKIKVEAIAAYNIGKQFHPKENAWAGYLITAGDTIYYIAGDTDVNADVSEVHCDVALLPCGGKYTMDAAEAATLAEKIAPKLAIPTHYGSVAGDASCGIVFAEKLNGKIEASVRMEY